jgi:hypothetical protein
VYLEPTDRSPLSERMSYLLPLLRGGIEADSAAKKKTVFRAESAYISLAFGFVHATN